MSENGYLYDDGQRFPLAVVDFFPPERRAGALADLPSDALLVVGPSGCHRRLRDHAPDALLVGVGPATNPPEDWDLRLEADDAPRLLEGAMRALDVPSRVERTAFSRLARAELCRRELRRALTLLRVEHEALTQRHAVAIRALSHDLRTPLAVILGNAEMLGQADLPDTGRAAALAAIARQARRIDEQATAVATELKPIARPPGDVAPLLAVVKEATEQVHALLTSRKLNIALTPPEGPTKVMVHGALATVLALVLGELARRALTGSTLHVDLRGPGARLLITGLLGKAPIDALTGAAVATLTDLGVRIAPTAEPPGLRLDLPEARPRTLTLPSAQPRAALDLLAALDASVTAVAVPPGFEPSPALLQALSLLGVPCHVAATGHAIPAFSAGALPNAAPQPGVGIERNLDTGAPRSAPGATPGGDGRPLLRVERVTDGSDALLPAGEADRWLADLLREELEAGELLTHPRAGVFELRLNERSEALRQRWLSGVAQRLSRRRDATFGFDAAWSLTLEV